MSEYRGDTVGKKIARYVAWNRIMGVSGVSDGRRGATRALYLASHEGGDASVLSAFGVPPEMQLAVDYDGEALASFKAKWPEVPTVFGDIGELVIPAHQRFRLIVLDFCSHLNAEIIDTIAKVILNCGHTKSFVMAVAFMRGREKAAELKDIQTKARSVTAGARLTRALGASSSPSRAAPQSERPLLQSVSREEGVMSDGNLVTWRSVTHDRANEIARWVGWLLVCLAIGGAFFVFATDWVLQ